MALTSELLLAVSLRRVFAEADCCVLAGLNLSQNQLGSSLPANWSAGFDKLTALQLSANNLTSTLPAEWALWGAPLTTVNLSTNNLTSASVLLSNCRGTAAAALKACCAQWLAAARVGRGHCLCRPDRAGLERVQPDLHDSRGGMSSGSTVLHQLLSLLTERQACSGPALQGWQRSPSCTFRTSEPLC